AIGKEISAGGEGVLTPADYARAPVFPAMPAGGTLVLQAAPGPEVAGQVVDTTTERALVRLANMMPSGPEDTTLGGRITSARAMTMRAMSEVAEAARRVGGIEVSLDGTTEDVRGSLDKDQAKDIVDLAGDVATSVRSVHVTGVLDGMRVKRREYYLIDERDHEYHGAVDEDIIMKMRELLDRPVVATLEEVTRRTRAGKVGRRAYRLVGITAAQ
ncbi:MAG: hypothetical protein J0H73_09970, partial [Salana multivorans]|nr:hypothetical protein [Salana multivorans]